MTEVGIGIYRLDDGRIVSLGGFESNPSTTDSFGKVEKDNVKIHKVYCRENGVDDSGIINFVLLQRQEDAIKRKELK